MSSDQTIKDLQAQNAQFQQMFISLAKGQEDLKALILKEKKKKKKAVSILNMGMRFGERLKRQTNLTSSSKEGENQEEEKDPSPAVSDNDTDYNDEQYPPAEDRYKQLEDRMSAMEVHKIPGLDFEELGLVSGVVILQKFKAPVLLSMMGCPAQNSISVLMSGRSSPTQLIEICGFTSFKIVCQGLNLNGSTS